MNFFPGNTDLRRSANKVLRDLGIDTGAARIRENKSAPGPAWDVLHRAEGAARGRVVVTIIGRNYA